jgi:exodeoxyribonuclease V gamma subunit
VPVEELLETLGKLSGRERDQLVQTRPLQPWSAGNFNPTSGSFDHGLALAAQRLHDSERRQRRPSRLGLMATGQEALPEEAFLPKTLSIDALADALLAPHKLLLRDRLGLSVSFETAQVEDREPLELDTLDGWSLRTRMVDHLLDTSKDWTDETLLEALRDRVGGEGLLPMCAGGEKVLSAELEKARGVVLNLAEIAGLPAAALELSLQLEGCPLLVGQIDRVVSNGTDHLAQWHTVSKGANEQLRLRAWLHLLTAVAAGHSSVSVRLVGYGSASNSKRAGGDFMVFDGSVEDAQATLASLVGLWRLARRQPLPLFKKTSSAAANALEKCGDDLQASGAMTGLKTAVEGGWHGGYMSVGDVDDRWIRAFHVDYDPTDKLDDEHPLSLVGLSRQVWLPICRSLNAGKVLGAKWLAGGVQ